MNRFNYMAVAALGAFALAGITAQPLAAGWWAGANKVGRVAGPQPGVPVQPVKPDPTKVPAWEQPTQASLEKAALEKRPIVLFFPGEGPEYGDFYVYGDDYAVLARDNAYFVKIPYTENRDKAPEAGSPVPVSKMLSDNPSRDYAVAVGKPAFVVADWNGNAFFKLDKKPGAAELKGLIDKIPGKVEDLNKKLQKNFDAAKASWDKTERANALKAIMKNFKEDVVGMDAQQSTITLYHEILDATRTKISELQEKGDVDGLKGMAKEVKGTEVAKELEEAMKKLPSKTTQEKKG